MKVFINEQWTTIHLYDRDLFVEVLVYHQRRDIESCTCGWSVLGKSHPEHVADIYERIATSRERVG